MQFCWFLPLFHKCGTFDSKAPERRDWSCCSNSWCHTTSNRFFEWEIPLHLPHTFSILNKNHLWNTVDGSEIWRLPAEGKVVEIYHYLPPVLAPSQTGGWLALGISEGWKNQPPTVESLHIPSRWGSRANSSGHGYAIDGWKVGDAQYRCPAMVFPRWMWTIENPSSGWKIHGMERPVDHQCGF